MKLYEIAEQYREAMATIEAMDFTDSALTADDQQQLLLDTLGDYRMNSKPNAWPLRPSLPTVNWKRMPCVLWKSVYMNAESPWNAGQNGYWIISMSIC
jgi:hypothetical protein